MPSTEVAARTMVVAPLVVPGPRSVQPREATARSVELSGTRTCSLHRGVSAGSPPGGGAPPPGGRAFFQLAGGALSGPPAAAAPPRGPAPRTPGGGQTRAQRGAPGGATA